MQMPRGHRTVPAAEAPDPMIELMGWRAEPLLCTRLKWYVLEAFVELGSLLAVTHMAQSYLIPGALFVRLLLLPVMVAGLKLSWSIRLACGYYRARGREVAEVIQRMSTVHTRSFWSCSAAILTCLSCVLMVWHSIMFLLMAGYSAGSQKEEMAAKFLLMESAVFVVVNWVLWRDFVNNYKDTADEPEDVRMLYAILQLHRHKAIQVFKAKDLADEEIANTTCAVCLEEFSSTDLVSRLPCGHVFHPTCAHKWIMEDWRCPFRCSLDVQKLVQQKEAASLRLRAAAPDDNDAAVAVVDLEAATTTQLPTPPVLVAAAAA